ncbi:uncharacterized protein IL334_001406 [Kwoniella shivajii]|uniref:Uncharacterized protein n=1 Tax=Kwoniella shivajii TaxID=564305 RepID=A0ABZ1CTF9_9TREE|nr:hypothetical protein IL334_001406 [Kwoniella shivajii]
MTVDQFPSPHLDDYPLDEFNSADFSVSKEDYSFELHMGDDPLDFDSADNEFRMELEAFLQQNQSSSIQPADATSNTNIHGFEPVPWFTSQELSNPQATNSLTTDVHESAFFSSQGMSQSSADDSWLDPALLEAPKLDQSFQDNHLQHLEIGVPPLPGRGEDTNDLHKATQLLGPPNDSQFPVHDSDLASIEPVIQAETGDTLVI